MKDTEYNTLVKTYSLDFLEKVGIQLWMDFKVAQLILTRSSDSEKKKRLDEAKNLPDNPIKKETLGAYNGTGLLNLCRQGRGKAPRR